MDSAQINQIYGEICEDVFIFYLICNLHMFYNNTRISYAE